MQARVWHLRAARSSAGGGAKRTEQAAGGSPVPDASSGRCISPISPLHLPCISPISPLHLPYSPDASSGRFSAEMSLGVTRFGERPPSDGREGVSADVSRTCRGRVVGVSWACRGRVVGCVVAESALLCCAVLCCAGLGWAGLGCAGLGWAGLGWAGLGWAVLVWFARRGGKRCAGR